MIEDNSILANIVSHSESPKRENAVMGNVMGNSSLFCVKVSQTSYWRYYQSRQRMSSRSYVHISSLKFCCMLTNAHISFTVKLSNCFDRLDYIYYKHLDYHNLRHGAMCDYILCQRVSEFHSHRSECDISMQED
jgi:hypothetical protein